MRSHRRRLTITLLAPLALPCAPALDRAEEGSGDGNDSTPPPQKDPPPPQPDPDTMTGM